MRVFAKNRHNNNYYWNFLRTSGTSVIPLLHKNWTPITLATILRQFHWKSNNRKVWTYFVSAHFLSRVSWFRRESLVALPTLIKQLPHWLFLHISSSSVRFFFVSQLAAESVALLRQGDKWHMQQVISRYQRTDVSSLRREVVERYRQDMRTWWVTAVCWSCTIQAHSRQRYIDIWSEICSSLPPSINRISSN